VRFHKPLAAELAARSDIISVLCDMIEIPSRRFASLQSQEQKKRQLSAQLEAVALIHRFVRSSEAAVDTLRQSVRLRKALTVVSQAGENVKAERSRGAATWAANAVAELQSVREGKADMKKNMKTYKVRKQSNVTAVAEYNDLQVHQMAKVASWGLGGVQWKPRVPGQRGLRILSLDGGGTRGVLSIAFLKEILKRVDRNLEPYQMFDLICGTSTGGIIATLLGAQQASLAEAEVLYDAFIDKIFAQRSNLRLVTEQAAYDGRDWEKILYDMCGDQLLLDSNQHDCARVFCVSTKVNVNPPLPNLWRNYNYPPGQRARYPGACRVNTFTAIRATTAAPTFFTPVQWENGLYCDGALVANNPTAIALQEAKVCKRLFSLHHSHLWVWYFHLRTFFGVSCV
jgi:predicted patatin/cPLA2 family phospholipase